MATTHKRFNAIDTLMVDGVSSSEPMDIQNAILEFYQNLYREIEAWRPNLNIQGDQSITGEEQVWMSRQFEEDEVLKGIKLCVVDKAPGPDGYTMAFFQAFWDVLKEDLMLTFQNFHSQQMFEKSFNATFMALIPKKVGATELRDFRTISLITGVYKIIAKVLAERLKRVVGKLVNKHQMTFHKVEANYGCCFNSKWLKWMEFCIKTTRFSILVNGEPVGFFPAERGLRQGDLLSPFLFIIAMEGLDSMMRIASQNSWIRGFNARNRENEAMEQICHLRVILVVFEAYSGLKVNWRKRSIFPVKEVQQIQVLASILNCKIENLPTVYLGMPLGSMHKAVEIWDGVIEKTEKKLAL
ncbi:uncharacterized protein LOC132637488 [Lycium barbarum]|uniref:uncharacterized protein LOC132637488 n=1 Tax=Lycium barbarum TaxID=112863 RepID=UPI00293ECAD4|nr:uncharacterized protein LOC132637488 [Lycium barbarum]